MSNLQVLGRRCPVMGKAMVLQSTKAEDKALTGVFGGTRAYKSKAGLHTSRARLATVDANIMSRRDGTNCDLRTFPVKT